MIAVKLSLVGRSYGSNGKHLPGYKSVRLSDGKVIEYPEWAGKDYIIKDLTDKGHDPGFLKKHDQWS